MCILNVGAITNITNLFGLTATVNMVTWVLRSATDSAMVDTQYRAHRFGLTADGWPCATDCYRQYGHMCAEKCHRLCYSRHSVQSTPVWPHCWWVALCHRLLQSTRSVQNTLVCPQCWWVTLCHRLCYSQHWHMSVEKWDWRLNSVSAKISSDLAMQNITFDTFSYVCLTVQTVFLLKKKPFWPEFSLIMF